MKESKLKSREKISVKAYANLIGKSDKTVYKMIKDDLVVAKKGKHGYEVVVDSYILEHYNDMNKEFSLLTKVVDALDKRLKTLESTSMTKKTAVKKATPMTKKVLKKAPVKSKTISTKKPLKKIVKKAPTKSTKLKNSKK